ncbi:MAG: response regulator [Anaerolineae bacterium]|nr:response regulator [Anaerolineae bacterium]MDW8171565.1 response regulator [Anaerolineae bacterium]
MPTILVIEDNVENARMVDKLLRRAQYEVVTAQDGEQGLVYALESQPDLILVDLGLPDLDGQTVVGLLRQQAHLKVVPIIAFTAWPEETAHSMAQAYGCDGIILKPIDTRSFAQQIANFIAQKQP